MFAKLPQLDEEYHKTNLGYVPTLSVIDNILVQYTVYWIDMDTHEILQQILLKKLLKRLMKDVNQHI